MLQKRTARFPSTGHFSTPTDQRRERSCVETEPKGQGQGAEGMSYKLVDYTFTTAAELARALLEYVAVPFEDVRLDKEKAGDAEKDTPFGMLPVLEVDGRVVAQHQSICRYLAAQHGLSGRDAEEGARCDLVMDGLWHMFSKIRRAEVHQLTKEERSSIAQTMLKEDAPRYLDAFEKMLKDRKNESDYIVGPQVTWSDIGLTLSLAALKYRHGLELESRPQLHAYLGRMLEVPQIAEFLAKRANEEAVGL